MFRRSPRLNVFIALFLVTLIFGIWGAWNFIAGPRIVGNLILPDLDNSLIETSLLLPGVELQTPITGQVLNGEFRIKIMLEGEARSYDRLEVYLIRSNMREKVFESLNLGNNVFRIDTTQFPDAICGYQMEICLVGDTTIRDRTGLFTVLNDQYSVSLGDLYAPHSQITNPPSEVIISKPGAGRIDFPSQTVMAGLNLSDEIQFSNGYFYVNPKAFPCLKNPGQFIRVHFTDIDFIKPLITLNGTICKKRCAITGYEEGVLSADIYNLGHIRVIEGEVTRLTTDNPTRVLTSIGPGKPVEFTASYTINSAAIHGPGVQCIILFDDGFTKEMTFSGGLYRYERAFSEKHQAGYEVQCEKEGNILWANKAYNMYRIT